MEIKATLSQSLIEVEAELGKLIDRLNLMIIIDFHREWVVGIEKSRIFFLESFPLKGSDVLTGQRGVNVYHCLPLDYDVFMLHVPR